MPKITKLEYRYLVVRMEVEVDEFGLIEGEYTRYDRAEDTLRNLVGYENARKAPANKVVKDVFI